MIYKKKTQNIIYIVLGVFLLSVILLIGRSVRLQQNKVLCSALADEKLSYEQFELAVCDVTEANAPIYHKSWLDENTGIHYLFLPSKESGKEWFWMFTGGEMGIDAFSIDDKKISVGDRFKCEAGDYDVSLFVGDELFYTISLSVRFLSDQPTMYIETDSGVVDYLHESKENYEAGRYSLVSEDGSLAYTGELETIRCRGNVSYTETDKKSYQMKLTEKADFFHMGADRKWLLLANSFDRTLLKNKLAYEMANDMGLEFTPEVQHVDLFMNGEYMGNYLLSEKVEVDDYRVKISNLEKQNEAMNPEVMLSEFGQFVTDPDYLYSKKGFFIPNNPTDITGGYLLELELSDRYGLEASGFLTSRMQAVVISNPEYASEEQVNYISNLYQEFENAIFEEDGYCKESGKYYLEYIDLESFASKYLLEETIKNLDASATSQYLYKYPDSVSSLLYAGPAWDYDKAFGVSGVTEDGIEMNNPVGLYAAHKTKDSDIWYGLYQHDDFKEKVADTYFSVLQPKLTEVLKDDVYQWSTELEQSAICNSIKWNSWKECTTDEERKDAYYGEIDKVVNFLVERQKFLTDELAEYK